MFTGEMQAADRVGDAGHQGGHLTRQGEGVRAARPAVLVPALGPTTLDMRGETLEPRIDMAHRKAHARGFVQRDPPCR
ncbi:MAG TPA: hypothetical protein PKZ76_01645 [Xanthomonadaceae bacterium]|nr:hypothetical protein [Xanthomonadaceae bacterium]